MSHLGRPKDKPSPEFSFKANSWFFRINSRKKNNFYF